VDLIAVESERFVRFAPEPCAMLTPPSQAAVVVLAMAEVVRTFGSDGLGIAGLTLWSLLQIPLAVRLRAPVQAYAVQPA
jgi:hypothetical protein